MLILTRRPIAKLSPAGVLTSLDNITAGIIDSRTTVHLRYIRPIQQGQLVKHMYTRPVKSYCTAVLQAPSSTYQRLLRITLAQYANLKSLFFTIGDRTFELTANAQIWPRALNEFIGGARGYLVRRLSSTTLGLSRSYVSFRFTFSILAIILARSPEPQSTLRHDSAFPNRAFSPHAWPS